MIHPQVHGCEQPYYLKKDGERVNLNSADAEEMSIEYYKQIFKEELGVQLVKASSPREKGEFKITELGGSLFEITYHNGNNILQLAKELFNADHSIAYRELLSAISAVLRNGESAITKEITIFKVNVRDKILS
jgi:hypothetical protein